jgi:hypothetical protein
MNQILLAGAVLLTTLAVTLHHRTAARTAASELAHLQAEKAAAKIALAEVQARSNSSSERQAELSLDLAASSVELKATSDIALGARTEPDPATEGSWPADKPYFYLPKRLLGDIGFSALTLDGAPTPEAIALLGLTPSERNELRNAWADFRFDLQERQVQSAERMPDTNSITDPNRRSIQFKLSSLTNHLPQLRAQLDTRLTDAVGSTRAQLLQSPLENRLDDLTGPLGDHDFFLTYHAQRNAGGSVAHYLRFDAIDGSSMHQLAVPFFGLQQSVTDAEGSTVSELNFSPDRDSPLWHYRHLFGDQPLLPLP